jgi:hypothetical protein
MRVDRTGTQFFAFLLSGSVQAEGFFPSAFSASFGSSSPFGSFSFFDEGLRRFFSRRGMT